MSEPTYYKIDLTVLSSTDTTAIIAKIDNIISALLTAAALSASKGDIAKFELDTGQTKEVIEYRNQEEIMKAVRSWKSLRSEYQADCRPRNIRLVDSKNFFRRNF